MGHCPFCKGAIPKELLINGGTCPRCLIEIPGEEAATDPGVEALARLQEEQAAATRGSPLKRLAFVLVSLMVLGGGGVYAWRSTRPVQSTASADEWSVIPLDAHQNVYQETDKATQSASGSGSSGAGTRPNPGPSTGGQLADNSSSSPGRASLNPATGSISDQVKAADPTAGMAMGTGLIGGPSISVGAKGAQEVLTDPAEVELMIRGVVARNGKQLEDCYSDRLKSLETLQGRWQVGFSVDQAGKARNVSVAALNGADAQLEACIQGRIERWQFKPIAEPMGMTKVYTFKP